jgi:hypothetical protein
VVQLQLCSTTLTAHLSLMVAYAMQDVSGSYALGLGRPRQFSCGPPRSCACCRLGAQPAPPAACCCSTQGACC